MIPAGIAALVVVAVVSGLIGAYIARSQILRVPNVRLGTAPSFAFKPRMGGRGMLFTFGRGGGRMHPIMLELLAEKLDLSVDELIDRMQDGEALEDIAEDQGLSAEELEALMWEGHEAGSEESQMMEEWGDWMREHMEGFRPRGRSPMWGGRGHFDFSPGFHFEWHRDKHP
jgi:hypothetical protein